jgi:colicin import membrane protein
MKTNYIKGSVLLAAALFIAMASKAQTSVQGNTSNSYDITQNDQGKHVERMEMDADNKTIKAELVDNKLTELYVNGEKIPPADWDKYSDVIATIREQIRLNKEQAVRNEAQAQLNEVQAKKNEEQSVRNQEQVRLNEIQAKKNQEQAGRNQVQVQLNEVQAKKNEEQNVRNQAQAQLNEIQAKKNQEQDVKNQEQSRLNELQAKKNEEQAKANERLMKELTEDLVTDKIIPDNNSLRSFKLDSAGMTVNGIKQPDSVFKKYREILGKASRNGMDYSNGGIYYNNR